MQSVVSYYPVGRKSWKWWRYIIWYLFDLVLSNAYILWQQCVPANITPEELRIRVAYKPIWFHGDIANHLRAEFAANKSRKRTAASLSAVGQQVPMLAANASHHECTKIKGRSKACVLCVLDGVKTERGYKRESAYMCKQCNVTLCRIPCFTQYHADRCMD